MTGRDLAAAGESKWSRRTISLPLFGAVTMAILLCLVSLGQKLRMGVSLEAEGFFLPLAFGSVTGWLVGMLFQRLLHTRALARQAARQLARAEAFEREKSRRLEQILDGTRAGTWEWNVQTGATVFNERWAEIVGYKLDELQPVSIDTWRGLAHPEDLKRSERILQRHFRGEVPAYDCVCRMRHRDGRWIWVHDRGAVMTRDGQGRPEWMFGTHLDVTDERLAQTELNSLMREARAFIVHARARAPLEDDGEGPGGGLGRFSWELVNFDPSQVEAVFPLLVKPGWTLPQAWLAAIHPADRRGLLKTANRALRERRTGFSAEFRARDRNGHEHWINQVSAVEADGEGIWNITSIHTDLTERKRAEHALRQSEARLELFFSQSLDAFFFMMLDEPIDWDGAADKDALLEEVFPRHRLTKCNDAFLRQHNATSEAMLGRSLKQHFAHDPVQGKAALRCLLDAGHIRNETSEQRPDGSPMVIEGEYICMRDEDGRITGHFGVQRDVTERRTAEAALRESEERFREIAETIREVFWITSPDKQRMIYVSPAYEEIWGRTCEELYAHPTRWIEAVHPDDRERIARGAMAQEHTPYNVEYRIERPDGGVRWIRDRAFPVFDKDGTAARIVGVAEDITARKQAEEHLRHGQKMEAVGLLAGGVAHDLNNMLSVIMLESDRIRGAAETQSVRESAQDIRTAADRSNALTRQLLLFSRRHELEIIEADLNEVVGGFSRILDRLTGDRVKVIVTPASAPLPVRVDVVMMEQVLANIATNARDALSDGGTLTVSLDEEDLEKELRLRSVLVPPGRYARVILADDGSGMEAQVLSRVFEPFFTTKPAGRGTGLGLAAAFGVISQHGGYIDLASKPGDGTRVTIRLPWRHESESATESERAGGAVPDPSASR